MYDDVPIVPNLYEAPSNPVLGDCYYNITLDKYYIYDGKQWLEAKEENDSDVGQEDIFELTYSLDGGNNFIKEEYTDFNLLVNQMNSVTIANATDISITMPVPYSAILIPRNHNTDLNGVALLKLTREGGSEPQIIFNLQYSKDGGQTFITEEYNNFEDLINTTNSATMQDVTDMSVSMSSDTPILPNNGIVGKIYPKIIFNQKLIENLMINTNEVDNSIFDGVLVFYKEPVIVNPYWDLTYTDSANNTITTRYTNYSELKSFIKNSSLDIISISIEEGNSDL